MSSTRSLVAGLVGYGSSSCHHTKTSMTSALAAKCSALSVHGQPNPVLQLSLYSGYSTSKTRQRTLSQCVPPRRDLGPLKLEAELDGGTYLNRLAGFFRLWSIGDFYHLISNFELVTPSLILSSADYFT